MHGNAIHNIWGCSVVTASHVIVERLLDWGVDVIFGLRGDGINGFTVP
jgi:thiamine pyrophosphate-dependent acetolactate synthase large subunit-like protein